MKAHVAVVGFMGAGKSTLGKRLARALERRFVDTDSEIIAATGLRVADLFAQEGEPAFRRREEEALRAAFAGEPAVVALGGGTLTDPVSRALVSEMAVRVYLAQDLRTLHARLKASRTIRPVLGPEPKLDHVAALFAQREQFYREAEIVVERPHSDAAAILAIVAALERLQEKAAPPTIAS